MDHKEEDKNKIDSVIDEVIYSKRLRQGFGFAFKAIIYLAIFFFVILIFSVAVGLVS